MIVIQEDKDLLQATFYAELTLADFQEFATAVGNELKTQPKIKLLLDLRDMSHYTLDVAWEDLKFSRAHAHDFRRIAVVASSAWAPWLSWVNAAFTDAEVMHFEDAGPARAWLAEH